MCGQAPQEKKKVAIVGSGMAGLVSGFLLAGDREGEGEGRFEVEVLEVQERLSLDSASYTLPQELSARSSLSGRPGWDLEKKKENAPCLDEDDEDEEEEEEQRRVDLPMRAFAAGYYDNLRKMYTYLGVEFEEPRFVYSLSTLKRPSSSPCKDDSGPREGEAEAETYFIHSSNNHILPPIRPAGMSVVRWVSEVVYLLFWYVWFTTACFLVQPKVEDGKSGRYGGGCAASTETLREYLSRIHIPAYYTSRYFLPLMSSVTTCTHEELLDFPAVDVVGYARRTFRRPHYTVKGGVKKAEGRLSEGLNVRLCARVTGVEPSTTTSSEGGKVKVAWVDTRAQAGSNNIQQKEYDYVIIAVTPDVVGQVFAPLAAKMKQIPTTSVQSVVHRDFSRISGCSDHLHGNRRFQARTSSTSAAAAAAASGDATRAVSAAIHMFTDLSGSSSGSGAMTESVHEHPSSMLITTYPVDEAIDEEKVLHRARFTRVLRSARSRDVVNGIFNGRGVDEKGWKNGDGGVFLVGGWCWDGMVMLEGCVVSAIRVAEMLGVDVPWVKGY
ncbi:hypothetical protein BJX61DRAFT_537149 [Aspergillus egyptiacus]|nr:hypothetical protein BJX61DRAFT_537149 [Aspergillus egyptiacus]